MKRAMDVQLVGNFSFLYCFSLPTGSFTKPNGQKERQKNSMKKLTKRREAGKKREGGNFEL